ncbi:MAG TPA: hypothetical protein VMH32_14565 [Burkholderiales bacterium]|nr:hypothetical protein [Burkholderiales bacterium]
MREPGGPFSRDCVRLWAIVALAVTICSGLTGPWTALGADQNQASETVRPEVGNPLQAAQELIKAHKYKQALAKIQEADSAKDKTAYEAYVIERLRGIAAAGAGEVDLAARSFESTIASGRLSAPDKLKMMEATAELYARAKDYPHAIAWASRYLKEGGTSEEVRRVLIQAYYLSGDCSGAEKELHAELHADESAGRAPPEDRLQLLASCYLQQADKPRYAAALEELVTYYPKQEYWAELIYRIQTKPGFSPRLGLDVYRLKLALGISSSASQFVEMTQLALQAGFPVEAKSIIDRGFALGVLGVGADAERQRRLRELATKSAAQDQKTLGQSEEQAAASAKDGTGLVNTGFAYVVGGQIDKGIDLMEGGIRKGGLKHPDDAKLHLGIAYLRGGQKEQAMQTFKSVQGTDGAADLARLWILYARRAT